MSKVVTIAGMHRSGSSLVASWLDASGLFLGEELLGHGRGNPRGHYEDVEILNLHEDILIGNSANYRVTDVSSIKTTNLHMDRMREIALSRSSKEVWGWKEPRTALFLHQWKSVIPKLKLLVIYRPYDSVVDSLLRRERSKKSKGRFWRRFKYSMLNPLRTKWLLDVWACYNQQILNAADQYPDDVLVFHIDDVVESSSKIISLMNLRWGLDLNNIDIHKVFDGELLKKDTKKSTSVLDFLSPCCPKIYADLECLRERSLGHL